ncbi:type II/IV secretion system protein [Anaerocolumna cellulosilytica]|uniref:Type II/IV secretion system protein n=1 Tax=Anaerocolumna cellulosilytica TaxID=433286 RepID=A0A6S6QPH2_9FIRM|nr:CpaF family protein [Anaerocolumna cellulosilytica]MBB5196206.1 pilus assembly protein CpaF [Anaerocolumna cellulosilytica]BCJ92474.1 type II/IV secretion system protein [Anaerocolumna cellulosilytica]
MKERAAKAGMEINKNKLQEMVLEKIDLTKELKDEEILEVIDEILLKTGRESFIEMQDKKRLRREIFNSIRRLDILQELLEDTSITEIMINGADHIFIEQKGSIKPWNKQFESHKKLADIVQQIVSKSNRIINEATPIVDTRLEDGSRVNIVLPPVAMEGPVITIRKFPDKAITIDKLIEIGSVTYEVSEFLEKLVRAGYNIFISGGTGSGKTTFLNVLSNFIPQDERVITIEDSAELQIKNVPNLVRLEVRNANVEGKNGVTIRDLIKSSLRMRPDRIVVGEVRDAAALDMLQAMNSGHDGSLSTGHANSAIDMLSRLETLVLMGTDIPLLAVRRQIASAIDIIVHLGRLRDKTRKVLEISEVRGCVDGEFEINKLYEFVETGEDKDGKVLGSLARTDKEFINIAKLKRAGLVP